MYMHACKYKYIDTYIHMGKVFSECLLRKLSKNAKVYSPLNDLMDAPSKLIFLF